jgi:hypothetical protein
VKDRQDSIAARIAGTIAGGVRRRQQDRTPRALVYDATGEPHVVPAGSEQQVALIEAADALVEIALAGAEPEEEPAADDGHGAPPE